MMAVHPYQAEPKCNHSCMTCRACVKLPLDVDGIDAKINNQIMKPPHDILLHLEALYSEKNPYIGTLKEEKGYIFSEW